MVQCRYVVPLTHPQSESSDSCILFTIFRPNFDQINCHDVRFLIMIVDDIANIKQRPILETSQKIMKSIQCRD